MVWVNLHTPYLRLLADVDMALEDQTTVVVGRNNSGKTSLSEVIRRFVAEPSPEFQIEDFSSASHDCFCTALKRTFASCFQRSN